MPPISRKKYILVLCAALCAFLVLCFGALLLSRNVGATVYESGSHPLRFSEIMTKNTAYPNPDGRFCDWIEIRNTSDGEFNLSGYRLSDDITTAKYAFPVGTVIPAGGYIVVWCDSEMSGGLYAPFGLSRRGGETLTLMNSANVVLDEITTLPGERNCSFIRSEDDSFTITSAPTPGYPNTDEGYAEYLASTGQGGGAVRLSEILSGAKLYTDPQGLPCDWIEVCNTGSAEADISGMHLSDKEGELRYTFPAGTVLPAGGFAVVWCSGEESDEFHAAFSLDRSGETVILTDGDGNVLDRVPVPLLEDDTAYARMEGGWVRTRQATPGYPNDEAGYAAWAAERGFGSVTVQITEVCIKNTALLRDGDGEYTDWLELTNTGAESVSLQGWYLSDKPDKLARWEVPELTLAPGESAVIFASGKNRREGELHTDFSLSAGETLFLTTPIGTLADSVELPLIGENHSFLRSPDGTWSESLRPTPGENRG